MSVSRRIRREQDRQAQKHFMMLGDLLSDFYAFLASKPQPSDESVRAEFIKRDRKWRAYCSRFKLKDSASLLFNNEVAQSWKRKSASNDKAQD